MQLVRPAVFLDVRLCSIALLTPAVDVVGLQVAVFREVDSARERQPRGDIGHGVAVAFVELPDAGVVVGPDHGEPIETVLEQGGRPPVELVSVLQVEPCRFQQVSP